jgi:hypothetical protein
LAVAALAAGVFALVKIYQNEQARIKGLGDAAALTASQLAALTDVLGIQFRESAFSSEVIPGEAAAIDPTEQDKVRELRESDQFKEEFGDLSDANNPDSILKTLKNASEADAARILTAQAAQLAALTRPASASP